VFVKNFFQFCIFLVLFCVSTVLLSEEQNVLEKVRAIDGTVPLWLMAIETGLQLLALVIVCFLINRAIRMVAYRSR
jgi:hypothetical protein